MYLTKLTLDPRSVELRRDLANIHDMHRTVMSAYLELPPTTTYRQAHGVLWRLDPVTGGYLQYVQSRTEPDWATLATRLIRPAEVRSLEPVLASISSGRKYAFRLVGNPTRWIQAEDNTDKHKRVALRHREAQIEWLVNKGEQHGFVIPTTPRSGPDVAPTAIPALTGRRSGQTITIEPVRFDGHLIVTDPTAFTEAVTNGIGRAKAYGCGLLSLAPPRSAPTR